MKKLILILYIIFLSSISLAHMAHYNKYNKIEMEIFRNDELVGYSNYFFNRKGNETSIINQTKFSIKILGATIFQIESYSEEKYMDVQLISFSSKTLQNNKEKFVDLIFDKKTKKFFIKGSSYNGEASGDNIVGNWWNHKILQTNTQISPISGSVKDQVITFIGKEKIELYGKIHNVDHFTLKSKDMTLAEDKRLDFDIWYDKENSQIIKVSYTRMGEWEYRLKSIE